MPGIAVFEQSELVAAVEQTADSIVITDANGVIQYVNPAFTAMTGYKAEEVSGKSTSILRSGYQSDQFYQNLWKTIESGRVWDGEVINRRKDATLYQEEMRITPVKDPQGGIVSYVAIKREVTMRRAGEEAQKFLAAVVEGSEDAIVAYSPSGYILTWNPGAKMIYGYTAEEAIGKHISMLLPPDQMAGVNSFTEQILKGNSVSQYDAKCLRKDGREIHVAASGSAIRDFAGNVAAISTISRDMSSRLHAEKALHESEERFRGVFENAPFGMAVNGLDGLIIQINSAFCQMLGYSKQDLLGTAWTEFIHPDDLPKSLQDSKHLMKNPGKLAEAGNPSHSPRRTRGVGPGQIRIDS